MATPLELKSPILLELGMEYCFEKACETEERRIPEAMGRMCFQWKRIDLNTTDVGMSIDGSRSRQSSINRTLIKVISFLSIQDQKNCSQINRLWYQIAQQNLEIPKIVIPIPNFTFSHTASIEKTLVFRFVIENVIIATLSLFNATRMNLVSEELSIQKIQFFRWVLESGHFKTMSQELFDPFIRHLFNLSVEDLQKIFLPITNDYDLSNSLLYPNCVWKLLSLFHNVSVDKLVFLFRQLSAEKLFLLFSQRTFNGLSTIHIACFVNKHEFMRFFLNQIPKSVLEHCLVQKSPEVPPPFMYSIHKKLEASILAIVEHAKAQGIVRKLLYQRDDQDVNFSQYLCYFGNTKLFISILNLLNSEEQLIALSIGGVTFDQALIHTLRQKNFETFNAILRFLPDFLFFNDTNNRNLLHGICVFGIYEAFDLINAHLIAHKFGVKESWRKLLLREDLLDSTPVDFLAEISDGIVSERTKKSILILQEIKKYLDVQDYGNLVSELMFGSIRHAHFDLTSYLIEKDPSILLRKSKEGHTIWHSLVDIGGIKNENKRIEQRKSFFFRYFNSSHRHLLNQIDRDGLAPLHVAQINELAEFTSCYIKAGAKPISAFDSIYSSKLLSHCWSIDGTVSHHLGSYTLTGWSSFYALKEIYTSLKAYSQIQSLDSDLLEAFSIFNLPLAKQKAAMMERAFGGQLWMKPIALKGHQVTIVGSSKLILFIDTAPVVNTSNGSTVTVSPALIWFLKPLANFSYTTIFDIDDHQYSARDLKNLLVDLINSHCLQSLASYQLRPQAVGNCTYESAVTTIFAYMGLSKLQEIQGGITVSHILPIFNNVKPIYKKFLSFNRWHTLELHERFANEELITAIESIALVRFALKAIKKNPPPDPFSLIVSYVPRNDSFHTNISETTERVKFIKHLYLLNQPELIHKLANFVREKKLRIIDSFFDGYAFSMGKQESEIRRDYCSIQ